MNTTATNHQKIRQILNGNDLVTAGDIQYALYLKGVSQTDIAKEADVKKSTVSLVIKGDRTSYNIASVISALLNVPLKNIWTDGRYSKPQQEKAA